MLCLSVAPDDEHRVVSFVSGFHKYCERFKGEVLSCRIIISSLWCNHARALLDGKRRARPWKVLRAHVLFIIASTNRKSLTVAVC